MCYSTKGYSINVLSVIQARHFQSMRCQLFNQGIFMQCVVSYSTKGFSINVLSVIQIRDFQSMCYQLFNQGIFNQCVVSYSTKGFFNRCVVSYSTKEFPINVLSVIQPRDFQSMCCQLLNQGILNQSCQLFNQGSYLSGCVLSTAKNFFLCVTNSC